MNEGAVYIYVFSFLRCAFAVVLFKYSRMTQAFNNITLRLFVSGMSAAHDIRLFCLFNFVFYCILCIPCVLGMLIEADLFSCFPLVSFSSFLYVLKFTKQLKYVLSLL